MIKFVLNHDVDAASTGCNPSVVATVGTVALGAAVLLIGSKLKVAQGLATDSNAASEIKVTEDPEQKAILVVGSVMKQLADWRQCIWDDERLVEGDNSIFIENWARKNSFTPFSYNKYSDEVYRLIMCITGHMICIARMDTNIPDYVRSKGIGYCSSLILAFDLLTWYILEATSSEDSPFFIEDDKMKDSDVQYMDRCIKELNGFLDALKDNMSNLREDGKSGVLTYLEANDFITVSPLYSFKKSKAAANNSDFLHIAEGEELKYIGDIPNMLVERFYKRIRKNLEEPCKMSRLYAKRKEILGTAKEVKDLIQILKEAGRELLM